MLKIAIYFHSLARYMISVDGDRYSVKLKVSVSKAKKYLPRIYDAKV